MSGSDLLARSPFFSPLPDEEQRQVERRFVWRRHDRDEYIFFEGDPAEWLVFVVEGRVKMIKHSESGRETILATFGPGQIVGEVGVLTGDVYPATAQALEASVTANLRRAEYVDLVRADPDLAWALIEELGRRLRRAHETIRSLAVEKVERRVARVLLRMASASGERLDGGAVRITVALSLRAHEGGFGHAHRDVVTHAREREGEVGVAELLPADALLLLLHTSSDL